MMNMKLNIAAWTLALALTCSAQAGTPYFDTIAPPGGQRGTTVSVLLFGEQLQDIEEVVFYSPGIKAVNFKPAKETPDYRGRMRKLKPGQGVRAEFVIDKNARIGEHKLRIRTVDGVSELRTFQIGRFPDFKEPAEYKNNRYVLNDDAAHAVPVKLNTTVTGYFWTSGDVDFYKVDAKKGQRISAEVEGHRLGHLLRGLSDPYVAIHDGNGKILAECDDTALFTQDPVASIVAPKDGPYFVEVRHNMYMATRYDTYRVSIGTFSRPMAVYPLGGPAGQKLKIQVLGDPTGKRSETIQLPDSSGDFEYFARTGDTPAPPNPNTLRVTDAPNLLEREPNDKPDSATAAKTQKVPAFNGIISKSGDVDYFSFNTRKGQRYKVRVYARSLGSPLDARIRIERAPGSAKAKGGSRSVGADDSRTSQMDLPQIRGVIKDNLDPIIVFTAVSDGKAVLRVDDQRNKGGDDYVYRVEFQPISDAIYTYIPNYGNRRNYQMRNSVNVARGNRYMTTVSLLRAFGGKRYDGELELVAKGLPKGVTMHAPRFTKGMDRVPVVFECAQNVPTQAVLLDLAVRPVDQSKSIESGFRESISSAYYGNNTLYFHRFTEKLAFAVADMAPFTIELEQPKAALMHNGEMNLKFKVKRKPGFSERVSVDLEWRPAGINGSTPITLEPDETEGVYRLSAGRGAPTGTYRIAVTAMNGLSPRTNYRETGAGKFFVSSKFVNLTVAEPYVNFRISRASVERGKTATLSCRIEHIKKFEGKAKVTLRRLPRGIETVEPFKEITAEDKTVEFTIKASPDALMGQYRGVYCRVAINVDGQEVQQSTGYGILRVDAPRGVKTSKR